MAFDTYSKGQTQFGLDSYRTISLLATSQVVKAGKGNIYGLFFTNSNAAVRYVKIYDAAAAVNAASAVPILTLPAFQNIPVNVYWDKGLFVSNGIVIRAVTEVADTGTTAPAANEVIGAVLYK